MWESKEFKEATYMSAYGGNGKSMRVRGEELKNFIISEEIGKDRIQAQLEALEKARKDFETLFYQPNYKLLLL